MSQAAIADGETTGKYAEKPTADNAPPKSSLENKVDETLRQLRLPPAGLARDAAMALVAAGLPIKRAEVRAMAAMASGTEGERRSMLLAAGARMMSEDWPLVRPLAAGLADRTLLGGPEAGMERFFRALDETDQAWLQSVAARGPYHPPVGNIPENDDRGTFRIERSAWPEAVPFSDVFRRLEKIGIKWEGLRPPVPAASGGPAAAPPPKTDQTFFGAEDYTRLAAESPASGGLDSGRAGAALAPAPAPKDPKAAASPTVPALNPESMNKTFMWLQKISSVCPGLTTAALFDALANMTAGDPATGNVKIIAAQSAEVVRSWNSFFANGSESHGSSGIPDPASMEPTARMAEITLNAAKIILDMGRQLDSSPDLSQAAHPVQPAVTETRPIARLLAAYAGAVAEAESLAVTDAIRPEPRYPSGDSPLWWTQRARECLARWTVALDGGSAASALERHLRGLGGDALAAAARCVENAASAVLARYPVYGNLDRAWSMLPNVPASPEQTYRGHAPASPGTAVPAMTPTAGSPIVSPIIPPTATPAVPPADRPVPPTVTAEPPAADPWMAGRQQAGPGIPPPWAGPWPGVSRPEAAAWTAWIGFAEPAAPPGPAFFRPPRPGFAPEGQPPVRGTADEPPSIKDWARLLAAGDVPAFGHLATAAAGGTGHERLPALAAELHRLEQEIVRRDPPLDRLAEAAESLRVLGRTSLAQKAGMVEDTRRDPGMLAAEIPLRRDEERGEGRLRMHYRRKGSGEEGPSRVMIDLETTCLGPVAGDIRLRHGDLGVHLWARDAETASWMARRGGELTEALRGLGFRAWAGFAPFPPPPAQTDPAPGVAGPPVQIPPEGAGLVDVRG